MTTYHFTGAVAYDRLGSSWHTAAGLRSVSVIDPTTGVLPTNLVQAGLAVTWLTVDPNSRYTFSCDVPGVVVDFGSGAEALYANEVPSLAIAAGGATDTAVATLMGAPTSATRVTSDAVVDAKIATQHTTDSAAYAAGPLVTPPTGFAFAHLTLPAVHRLGSGRFLTSLDAVIAALRPAAGVTYYVAPAGTTGNSGLTSALPTTIGSAMGKADVGTIRYAPGEYGRSTHPTTTTTKSINHLAVAPGVRVTGWNGGGSCSYTHTSGAIYQTSRSATSQVVDVTNRTAWGDFTVYTKMADLASIAAAGQWALVGSTVYVWAIGDTDLTVSGSYYQIRLGVTATTGIIASAGVTYVRGIDFEGCDNGGAEATGTATVIAEDCTFRYATGNGGAMAVGGYGYITRRCECSSNATDGFSYHGSAGNNPDFIEIDCISHHNGLTVGATTNNATTCHEVTRGLRVCGDYDMAAGPVVADVNSAKTWNLGCRSGESVAAVAQCHSWRVDCAGFEGAPAAMWLDECSADTSTYAYKATGVGSTLNVNASRPRCPTVTDTTGDGVVQTYVAT